VVETVVGELDWVGLGKGRTRGVSMVSSLLERLESCVCVWRPGILGRE